MRRGVALGVAATGLITFAASCASNERMGALEEKVKADETTASADSAVNVRWHGSLVERLDAIERREEFARIELARLERWQRRLQAKEKEIAEKSPDAPKPTPGAASPDPAPAKGDWYSRPGQGWGVFERAVGQKLVEMYATGKSDPQMLKAKDVNGLEMTPRDPGKTGVDGDNLVGKPLARTRFLASTGETIDLKDYVGKKNVVLVVLRGFDGAVCIACTGQTLAISQKLEDFEKAEAEVFLVYPGKADAVPKFLDAVRDLQGTASSLPVDMLLDVDLAVVREFKIEGRLAKPTTVVVDKKGVVRFAHVGQTKTDRPTVPQMLEVLSGIKASEGK